MVWREIPKKLESSLQLHSSLTLEYSFNFFITSSLWAILGEARQMSSLTLITLLPCSLSFCNTLIVVRISILCFSR